MKRSLVVALAIQVAIMVMVLVPPLIVRSTGTRVLLETRRVDPRALFRGDYVILDYPLQDEISHDTTLTSYEVGDPIYVTVTTERPAQYVYASLERPKLQPGQACLTARARYNPRFRGSDNNQVHFPQIAQFFVPEGEGKELQKNLDRMVAEISTTSRCNAVIVGLELL